MVSFEEKVNKMLLDWKKTGKITDKLYHRLHLTGSQPPRLYGLGKNHKKDTPMRPVLSMCGSMYYNIASKLAKWLSVIPETSINCNTADISQSIKNLKLDDNERLISFDISGLYTNVPWQEALNETLDKLYSGEFDDKLPPISKRMF